MPTLDQENEAAWQPALGAKLEVGPAALAAPGPREILVRNAALAVNPADWILQDQAIGDAMTYPMILGNDVAGEVVAVGEGAARFAVGDRVLGQATGCWTNAPSKGGFQRFTVLDANMAATIPDAMAYTDAVVLPLGVGTAACGLFQTDHLGLAHPKTGAARRGETVLVWGGASSVGSCAIQLAHAAGYDVVTTASPKNADALEALGAVAVLDYRDPGVAARAASMLGGAAVGALFAVGDIASCCEAVAKAGGRRFVSSTLPLPDEMPDLVTGAQIFGISLRDNEVGKAVYEDFLPVALATGAFRPAPPAEVIGSGLVQLQGALDRQKAGVSARKIVLTMG